MKAPPELGSTRPCGRCGKNTLTRVLSLPVIADGADPGRNKYPYVSRQWSGLPGTRQTPEGHSIVESRQQEREIQARRPGQGMTAAGRRQPAPERGARTSWTTPHADHAAARRRHGRRVRACCGHAPFAIPIVGGCIGREHSPPGKRGTGRLRQAGEGCGPAEGEPGVPGRGGPAAPASVRHRTRRRRRRIRRASRGRNPSRGKTAPQPRPRPLGRTPSARQTGRS